VHGATIKIINAQQARFGNIYKNTKLELLKVNAAIWFNKICREKQLKPKNISPKINGRRQQDIRTTTRAIKFRINQEIRFLCKKKQHLNQQLYQKQLECAKQQNGMWQHIQNYIDQQINKIMESQYHKFNKKLDVLTNQTPKYNTKQKVHNFQPRIINLSDVRFTKEQIQTLSLGPNYAIET
jgi:ribosomal protein S30